MQTFQIVSDKLQAENAFIGVRSVCLIFQPVFSYERGGTHIILETDVDEGVQFY